MTGIRCLSIFKVSLKLSKRNNKLVETELTQTTAATGPAKAHIAPFS
jgi:hypothetical protein